MDQYEGTDRARRDDAGAHHRLPRARWRHEDAQVVREHRPDGGFLLGDERALER